ncbi:replication initiation protein (plasmid) [Clostridium botulinum]|uniref:replication initiation protein n=1 Tax=Clostridium botulinum TaxID=1491 RepID=UPI0022455F6A|nr:replication initiation protein [Clostridium botulinum]UZP08579.1 replication initiation protein [Clostridium botulinum]UZP11917.1 replication initiation protein [Clostridium botulinum]
MDKRYIVTKANSLITANYDLSLQEQKLILTLASMVQPNDAEFKEYEIKIKDFMNLLDVRDEKKYIEIPKITKELMKKVFEIKEGKDIIQLAWLSSARYRTGQGMVLLKFDSSLKPYMLQLKELYTSYKLENILSLKSKYSLRIYEILKCNQFKKVWEVELVELKKILGITEKSYSVYQNVKNRIIIQAQKELKEKTDISFEFEEIKTGRKVTSIKFIIKINKVNGIVPKDKKPINEVSVDIEETPKDIKLIMEITKNEFGEKTAMLFRDLSNGDIEHISKLYEYMNTKNVKENRVGYMRTLLKNFEEPKKSTGTTKFNNFEPRQYDYDSLERKLLGWEDNEE